MKTFKFRFITLLLVCTFGVITAFAQDYVSHKIAKGETLYSIAEKYGVTVDDIKKANPKVGNYFYAGLTIQIPNKKGAIKSNPTIVENKTSDVETNKVNTFVSNETTNVLNDEEEIFEGHWNIVDEFGYGFIGKNDFAGKFTIGGNYHFTKSFYVGAQIGYNSFSMNDFTILKPGYVDVETDMHFIYLPLETGYKFMSDNGKLGIIPFAGLGLNIGLKGKTKIDYGKNNEEENKLKIGGKLGFEGRIGVHISIYGFILTGSYHLPLNSKQEAFFGEDAYPELAIGFGI